MQSSNLKSHINESTASFSVFLVGAVKNQHFCHAEVALTSSELFTLFSSSLRKNLSLKETI